MILVDGFTWGEAVSGGDSSAVRDQVNSSYESPSNQFDACAFVSS